MNPRTKIQPVIVEVSLRNAIARRLREHGVPNFHAIADEVMIDLTGLRTIDPPENTPRKFTIEGVELVWPEGLDTRVPTKAEYAPYNRALKAIGNAERMTTEDNVRVLRGCYTALWNRVRIQAAERAKQITVPVPVPTAPVVTTSMLEGRNPVLDAQMVVTPKKRAARKRKVEPVVSTSDMLTGLESTLADLRKTLEGAES